jgi:hypothetical protein
MIDFTKDFKIAFTIAIIALTTIILGTESYLIKNMMPQD